MWTALVLAAAIDGPLTAPTARAESPLPAPAPASPGHARDPALERAVSLYNERRFSEACAALEPLASGQSPSPEACHYLALAIMEPETTATRERALPWLEKAVRLAPSDAEILSDYGGTCLQLARSNSSYSLATHGRDALEKAVSLNSGDLESRHALVEFYSEAPWPLGDMQKARRHAADIGRRDPRGGAAAFSAIGAILEGRNDRSAAAAAYRSALELDRGNTRAAEGLARMTKVP